MNTENEFNKANYYAIIPASVRYNNNLKPAEKLLYGEITALSNLQGYCYASNKYFANLYDVTTVTVSRWVSHLAELGFVKVQIIKSNKNEIVERRIYIADTPSIQKNQYPSLQNSKDPINKTVKDNNINNNIINTHTGDKLSYADNVFLYEYEYQNLVAEFGKEKADECIKELSLYKKSSGKNYKDDCATIKRWVIARVEELRNSKKNISKANNCFNLNQRDYKERRF